MPPKPSDPHDKALAAGAQLQEALLTAAKALTTIAGIVPNLFPEATGSTATQRAASLSPVVNRRLAALTDETSHATPQSNKRKRTQKDPDAPEKPLSAYHLYAKEKREQLKNTMGSASSASDVVHEINRMWKDLSDELKKPFLDSAEKLKETYKQAFADYEQSKGGEPADKPSTESSKKPAEPAPKAKATPKRAGFTAVTASPLNINPDNASEDDDDDDDDSRDAAAVAAELGGSQHPSPVSPTKKQKKNTAKQGDSSSAKKDKKEKTKDKEKEKKKRRKSDKTEA